MKMKVCLLLMGAIAAIACLLSLRSQRIARRQADALELNYFMSSGAQSGTLVRALKRIREGDTNGAIHTLETELKGQLTILEDYRQRTRSPDTNILHVLGKAEDYRAMYMDPK